MKTSIRRCLQLASLVLATVPARQLSADSFDRPIQHVLLISIDGIHSLDFINCANDIAGVNGGLPYCPNLSSLKPTGLDYLDASTSKPSDSFPGLMALVTGGSPWSVGAFYDVAQDRSLDPPAVMTGNGVAGGACTRGTAPTGSTTEFDEGIDFEAPSGVDGGIASIDPQRLDRDPRNGARPFIHGISYVPMRFSAWCTRPEVTRRAPTILQALGLNPQSLQSVAMEGTGLLPGAFQFRH